MERDSLGRFLPGNQVTKGNRGNRCPKYGNSNASKHGLYSGYTGLLKGSGGGLSIYKNGMFLGSLPEKHYHITEVGEIMIDVKAVDYLVEYLGLPGSLFGEAEYF